MSTEPDGSLIVGGDSRAPLSKLIKIVVAINAYQFDSGEGGRFGVLKKEKRIVFDRRAIGCPSTFAIRAVDEDTFEDMTLSWISERISPLISKGTLEIVAVAGGSHDGYLERLSIHADGLVTRSHEAFNMIEAWKKKNWRKVEVERFKPRKKTR